MTDNEKAAIAAGLLDECPPEFRCRCSASNPNACGGCPDCQGAPDMHDPANLWRALENFALPVVGKNPQTGNWVCSLVLRQHQSRYTHFECPRLADAIFAALVALYDAEHKA